MKALFLGAVSLLALATPALAADKIHAGGKGGAYLGTFCPPLEAALKRARFKYTCAESAGTPDNIAKVQASPNDLGFVQLDVYSRWAAANKEQAAKLKIIRRDIACEGVWFVTKKVDLNKDLTDLGAIAGGARRTNFVLPPEKSGSVETFAFLGEIDPNGIGRAQKKNTRNVASVTVMLNEIASGDGTEVGTFTQFADPSNANIKLMVEKGLQVIPAVSRAMLGAEVEGEKVYQLQEFSFKASFIGMGGQSYTTACTPVAIITGSPAAFKDKADQDEQDALIKKVAAVPAPDLLPADDKIASILKNAKVLGSAATEKLLDGADWSFKKAAEALK